MGLRVLSCRRSTADGPYCAVTGFGPTGPYRNTPGFARVFEAMSGCTRMCRRGGWARPLASATHFRCNRADWSEHRHAAELYRLKSDPG